MKNKPHHYLRFTALSLMNGSTLLQIINSKVNNHNRCKSVNLDLHYTYRILLAQDTKGSQYVVFNLITLWVT